ncbi:MAG: hypothetical protein DRQ55_20520 [Planctomycetota bacterium]|nr:MAG: hypothetical protein DRQ55_20520 [Planctomycetota bacterium]
MEVMMRAIDQQLATTARMAAQLGVCPATLRRMVRLPGCPALRLQGQYRWPEADTLRWLQSRNREGRSTEQVEAPVVAAAEG